MDKEIKECEEKMARDRMQNPSIFVRLFDVKLEIVVVDKDLTKAFKELEASTMYSGRFLGYFRDGEQIDPGNLQAGISYEAAWETSRLSSEQIADRIIALYDELQTKPRPILGPFSLWLNKQAVVLFTHCSTAIEGNTLTLRETQQVADALVNVEQKDSPMHDIHVAGHPMVEVKEVVNHLNAVDLLVQLVQKNGPIQLPDILSLHATVMTGLLEDAGEFRKGYIEVTGSPTVFCHPEEVAQQMEEKVVSLLACPPAKDAFDYVEWACRVHTHLLIVHPFSDGNGRVSRLVMNLLLLRGNWPIIIVPVGLKVLYMKCIHEYENDNKTKLWRLMAELLFRSLSLWTSIELEHH